jgi:hypothetical protein
MSTNSQLGIRLSCRLDNLEAKDRLNWCVIGLHAFGLTFETDVRADITINRMISMIRGYRDGVVSRTAYWDRSSLHELIQYSWVTSDTSTGFSWREAELLNPDTWVPYVIPNRQPTGQHVICSIWRELDVELIKLTHENGAVDVQSQFVARSDFYADISRQISRLCLDVGLPDPALS